MKSILSSAVLAFASFSLLASPVMGQATPTDDTDGQPTVSPAADLPTVRTPVSAGCFKSSGDMVDMGSYTFQAMGWCQPLCIHQAKPYLAFVNGTHCFCGDEPPSDDDKVDDSNCQTSCKGFPGDKCGGTNHWAVFNDGYQDGDPTGTAHITVPTQPPAVAAAHSASTSTQMISSTAIITQSGGQTIQTVIKVTETAQADSSTGPNKVAIAVGVVVSVVAVLVIVGGLFFFMRHRKNTAIENERRRHQMMTNLVAGEKPGSSYSMADSRLDQGVMFQRRQSDGSIADNEDYSRRILKVTNPGD